MSVCERSSLRPRCREQRKVRVALHNRYRIDLDVNRANVDFPFAERFKGSVDYPPQLATVATLDDQLHSMFAFQSGERSGCRPKNSRVAFVIGEVKFLS